MGKFSEALKAKYRTPRAAIEALGLDPALLEKDIVVGDSKGSPRGLKEKTMQLRQQKTPTMSRQAALGIAVLASHLQRPKVLAKDAKLDLNKIFVGVTAKNFPQKKRTILRLLKPKLASDATIGEVAELLDMIDSHGMEQDTATHQQCKTVSKMAPPLGEESETSDEEEEGAESEAGGEQAEHLREEENHQEGGNEEEEEEEREDEEEEDAEDKTPIGRLKNFLKGKVSDEDMEHVHRIMHGDDAGDEADADAEDEAEDESGEETAQERRDNEKTREEMEKTNDRAKDKRATDKHARDRRAADKKGKHVMDKHKKRATDTEAGPPPFKGMPKPGGGMVDKKAMDAALDRAVADATRRTLDLGRQIRVAERFVMPWVGDAALDEAESPEEVYKIALDALQIDVEDVHPSAWKKILEMTPRPGTSGARSGHSAVAAADSANNMGPSKNALKLVDSLTPGISRIKQL
jgi:hypothetical protein